MARRSTRKRSTVQRYGTFASAAQTAFKVGKMVAQGLKRKRISSKSKTSKKRKITLLTQVQKTGNHSWAGGARWGRYRKTPPKAIAANQQENIQVEQYSERIDNPDEGQQGINASNYGTLWTLGQLKQLTDPTTVTPISATNSILHKWIKGGSIKFLGTNGGNTNIKVTVYNVVSRRDLQLGTDPVTEWATGYGTTQPGLAGTNAYTTGATPFESPYFTRAFKIWKVTNYFLSQGDSMVHTTMINANKKIDFSRIWQSTADTNPSGNSGYYGGLSQAIIVTVQGFPAHETTTRENIGIPRVSLDAIWLLKHSYYNMEEKVSQQKNISLLTNAPTSAYKVVNEDTGADVATYA